MKTLKKHQLERLQKIGLMLTQKEKVCEPKQHDFILNKLFKVRQLIFKHKL